MNTMYTITISWELIHDKRRILEEITEINDVARLLERYNTHMNLLSHNKMIKQESIQTWVNKVTHEVVHIDSLMN